MDIFLQLLVSGFAVGGVYALIALGFVLIYKATSIINFATGEFMMIGAYFFYSFMVYLGLPAIPAFIGVMAGAALLGFTHSQHGGMGVSFIAYMGQRQISKAAPRDAHVNEVIAEGRRHGRTAKRIIEQDIEAILDQPLQEVREQLGIAKPVLYKRALKVFSEQAQTPQLAAA